MLSIRSKFIIFISQALFAALFVAGFSNADELDHQLSMLEQSWNEDGGIVFEGDFIDNGTNSWGDFRFADFYMETTTANSFTDIYLPTAQVADSTRAFAIEFDVRYLTSASHNYLSFGNDEDLDNAIWFGFNNRQFFAGTGTELNVSDNLPASNPTKFSTDQTYSNDTRIGVRIGYDAPNEQLRNFQVDKDNDGVYDDELLDAPIDFSGAGLVPKDWYFVSYFGGTGSRIDDIFLSQLDLYGDYTNDLDFDGDDANAICEGIIAGDITFDHDQNGTIDIEDLNSFLNSSGSIASDFDYSGFVDFADFLILSGSFGKDGTYTSGDATCNGSVGFEDFLILSRRFNTLAGRTAAVPEPSGWALLVPAIACLVRLRRKRSN